MKNVFSFDEIFALLSSDFSYLFEDVNEDEINDYLDILKNNEQIKEKDEKSIDEKELIISDYFEN